MKPQKSHIFRMRLRLLFLLLLSLTLIPLLAVAAPTGNLAVTITGLPSGVNAAVKVTNSSRTPSFNQTLTASTTLTLPRGTYRVQASAVVSGTTTYVVNTTVIVATVMTSKTTAIKIDYQKAASLAVAITPTELAANVTIAGPNNYSQTITSSKTLTNLFPGTYTVTALTVVSEQITYMPQFASQTVSVSAGQAGSVSVNYGEAGLLNVTINPTMLPVSVVVTGANNYQKTLTQSAQLTLYPGSYTLKAATVTDHGVTYAASLATQTKTVSSGKTTAATVSYACSAVTFSDPDLEAVIRADDEINKPTGVLTCADMANLTELEVKYKEINNLNGLQAAVNLSGLDIFSQGTNEKIDDLYVVKFLTYLEQAYFGHNNISDLTPLAGLKYIIVLNLSYNPIVDISPIFSLAPTLSVLNIRNTLIKNYQYIANFVNLTYLDIAASNIEDVSFLESLIKITILNIEYDNVSDISGIKNMSENSKFSIYGVSNQLNDLSALTGKTVSAIKVGYNNIINIPSFKSYSSATGKCNTTSGGIKTSWNSNMITDLTPLVNNTTLCPGDEIYIIDNCLDLANPTTQQHIQTLLGRGIKLTYQPQKNCAPANLGNLTVQISGLEVYLFPANVSVTNSSGYNNTLSGSTTLTNLEIGQYQVTAHSITYGPVTCDGTATSAKVEAGKTTTASITYVCEDMTDIESD